MRRRRFLGLLTGTVAGFGTTVVGEQALDDQLDVRVWFSDAAADYDHVRERTVGYLAQALEELRPRTNVTVGRTLSLSTEDAYRVTVSGEWPLKLATGAANAVDDVNLLVTDGQMARSPTGIGLPHLASVGGAGEVAAMPPASETPDVVDFSNQARIAQVLVHECGHALGLRHDDGTIEDHGDYVVVSPMVSGYAWAEGPVRKREFDYDYDSCGEAYPDVAGKGGRLDMTFSGCAKGRVRRLQFGGL